MGVSKKIAVLATGLGLVLLSGCGGGKSAFWPGGEPSPDAAVAVHRNLIVVFADPAAAAAEAKIASGGSDLREQSAQAQLVVDVAAVKQEVLSNFTLDQVYEVKQYSHLPLSFVHVVDQASLDKLKAHPKVLGVYEDGVRQRAMLAQSLPLIGQPLASVNGYRGAGTSVVVIDQRVDYTNAAFGACAAPGVPTSCKVLAAQDVQNLVYDGLGFQDGHGTNVAATALAVAPGANIISLNVFNGANANDSDILSAINWSIANAARYNIVAMNLSLGSTGSYFSPITSGAYYAAFLNARNAGIVPVVSAGNSGYTSGLSSPGAVSGAVSVGAVYDSSYGAMSFSGGGCTDAVTSADRVTCFSNSASFLTLLAPGCRDDAGVGVNRAMCGTSQAAPHVAGAVAVLRAAFPGDSVVQTVNRLTNGVAVTDLRNGLTKPRLSLPMALGTPPCSYSVGTTQFNVGATGINGATVSVSSGAGCSWSASSNADWLSIQSGNTGEGPGSVIFSAAANNSASARSGTMTIAGQTLSVIQAAGTGTLTNTTGLWLNGTYGYATQGLSAVTMTVDQILNTSLNRSSGTLRLELWLTESPFGYNVQGYRIATSVLNSGLTLRPQQSLLNVSTFVPLVNVPGPGSYNATLALFEYDSNTCPAADRFCLVTWGGFNKPFIISDVSAPTVPGGVSATAVGATRVDLYWSKSADNVGVTNYKVYSSGNLLGRVTSEGAAIFGLSPNATYQFTVSACDAAENCSAQSARASVRTPAFDPQSGWWWNPNESGRGYFFEATNGRIFEASFLYANSGAPLWYAAGPTAVSNGFFNSTMGYFSGGQTLVGSYRTPSGPAYSGPFVVNFSDSTHATVSWPGGTTPLVRYEISSGSLSAPTPSFKPETGWWWNASESGRGFAIEVQGSSYFIAGFMYAADGAPTWYFAGGTMAAQDTISGTWQSCAGGQAVGGAYRAANCAAVSGGNLYLKFSTPTTANLTLPDGRVVALVRYMF